MSLEGRLSCKVISKGKHNLYTETGEIMETKLARISELSLENPDMVFTSVGHLINEEMLKDCHNKMDSRKVAVNIVSVTPDSFVIRASISS